MFFLHSNNLSSLPECNCKSPSIHTTYIVWAWLFSYCSHSDYSDKFFHSFFFFLLALEYENSKQKDEHVRWFCMRSSNCYYWLDTLYVSIQLKCESFSCSNTSTTDCGWRDINWIEISDVTFQSFFPFSISLFNVQLSDYL